MQTGAGSLFLFLMLGLAGSAAPAHIGFRVLAYRQHLDKAYAFATGTDDGNWGYSWWLMRWKHRVHGDPSLNFFGGIAAGSGWLALVGSIAVIVLIAIQ